MGKTLALSRSVPIPPYRTSATTQYQSAWLCLTPSAVERDRQAVVEVSATDGPCVHCARVEYGQVSRVGERVVHVRQQPAVVLGGGSGAGNENWFRDVALGAAEIRARLQARIDVELHQLVEQSDARSVTARVRRGVHVTMPDRKSTRLNSSH